MKNKLKIGLVLGAILATQSSLAAGGALLSGVKGTLKATEKPIKAAITTAESLYEQNKGGSMGAAGTTISLLTTSSANPFLQVLTIDKNDYSVVATFSGAAGAFVNDGNTGSSATVPTAKVLQGATVRFVPVVASSDVVINSWECITDADANVVLLGTNNAATVGNMSFISQNGNAGDNEYLSNCIYVSNITTGV